MKKLILLLSVLFTLTFTSKAQYGIGVQGGYDWLEGNIAAAGQFGNIGLTLGQFYTTMPGSGDEVTGFCWSVSLNDGNWDQSGYYLSIGQNSAGYRYELSVNGGSWDSDIIEPMWIGMLGYKVVTYSGIFIKLGVGYGWCDYASAFTYGISLGWMFGE